jgi:hypothetical protein
MKKLFAITALSLAMTGSALAQTTSSTNPDQRWSGPLADTFFEDETMTVVRPEADIRTRWGALTVEQQTMAREICDQGAPGGGGGMGLSEAQQQACNYLGEFQ